MMTTKVGKVAGTTTHKQLDKGRTPRFVTENGVKLPHEVKEEILEAIRCDMHRGFAKDHKGDSFPWFLEPNCLVRVIGCKFISNSNREILPPKEVKEGILRLMQKGERHGVETDTESEIRYRWHLTKDSVAMLSFAGGQDELTAGGHKSDLISYVGGEDELNDCLR